MLTIPTSVGELADKLTILSIKFLRIPDDGPARENVRKECELLHATWLDHGFNRIDGMSVTMQFLRDVNEQLWSVEDALRLCERDKNFGPQFVSLARTVYSLNDRRGTIKREINLMTGSEIIEEKFYAS